MTTVTNTTFDSRAGTVRPAAFRPANFPVTNTRDMVAERNGVDALQKIREQFAARFENGGHVKALLQKREMDDPAISGLGTSDRKIDLEDLEDLDLDDDLETKRGSNVPIKGEISRLRRALDRGERLSPSEMDRLGDTKLPEAKELLKINQQRMEKSPGITLSPIRALLRSL